MAVQPRPPLVSVEEYLNSSYYPDAEYVDGMLEERAVPTPLHSLFQALLAGYFRMHRQQFRYAVYTEVRTQIAERSRYRIPDVMLGPLPVERGKVITCAPLVVIEIQSPEDKLPQQFRRFRDYLSLGVPHVILLDPEELIAYRYQFAALVETAFRELELPGGRLPFDTGELFRQLTEELNETDDT